MSELEFYSPRYALGHWLKSKGISAYQLSKETVLPASKISEILNGKRRVTAETATILGAYFGTGADYWMAVQNRAELVNAGVDDWITYNHKGDLSIGGFIWRCYVLPDERRVVSARNFCVFLGINSKSGLNQRLIDLLNNPLLQSEKMKGLRRQLSQPFNIANEDGVVIPCYEGELIVEYCRALLDLRRVKDVLPGWAQGYATQAEILISSIAKVGITALIDEATGYQAYRHREALQRQLDDYFQKEKYGVWSKRFPDWFYEEIFRLRRWSWTSLNSQKPPLVGKLTKDIVYARLEDGVIKELESRNPLLPNGGRKVKHHQWLSDDIGHPALNMHLYALRGLFRSHKTWRTFHHALRLAFPKKNEAVQLELDDYLEGELC